MSWSVDYSHSALHGNPPAERGRHSLSVRPFGHVGIVPDVLLKRAHYLLHFNDIWVLLGHVSPQSQKQALHCCPADRITRNCDGGQFWVQKLCDFNVPR